MKKSWWFIVGAWTGLLCVFFSLFLNVVDMGEMSGGYSSFSTVLADISRYDKVFPIGLYNAFLIISFILCVLVVAFLVMEEFKLFNVDAKVMKLIKLITGGSVALFGILVLIFGISFVASLNSSMGSNSSAVMTMGGSAFACFFGSTFCGLAIAGNELLNLKKPSKTSGSNVVDADEQN